MTASFASLPLEELLDKKASKLMSISQEQVASLFTHEMQSNTTWWTNASAGGAGATRYVATDASGGVTRMFTSAGASDYWTQQGAAGPSLWSDALPFYLAARARWNGTIVAIGYGTAGYIGFGNGSTIKSITIGVQANISTTHFVVAKHDGVSFSGASLGVAIDSSSHLFEMWRNATSLYARIDNGAIQNITTAGVPTSGDEALILRVIDNAGDGAARNFYFDWTYFATRQAIF